MKNECALSIMLLNLGKRESKKKGFYTRNVASCLSKRSFTQPFSWNEMEYFSDIKQILISLGEVSKWFWEKCEGELVMPHLRCIKIPAIVLVIDGKINRLRGKIHHKSYSATPKLPTQPTLPNIFSSFSMAAFGLENPQQSSFLFIAILSKSTLITSKGSDLTVELLCFST